MKNILLLILIALPFLAGAQVEKGNLFLGGSLNFSTTPGDGPTPYSIKTTAAFSPRIGFFISGKSAIGGGVDVMHQKLFGGGHINSTGLAFFHRLYLPITESFFFILHSEVGGSVGKTDYEDLGGKEKNSALFIRTGPHFAYFVSKHWQLEASVGVLGLNTSTRKDDDSATKTTSTTFSFNAGSVGLGVYYYFRK